MIFCLSAGILFHNSVPALSMKKFFWNRILFIYSLPQNQSLRKHNYQSRFLAFEPKKRLPQQVYHGVSSTLVIVLLREPFGSARLCFIVTRQTIIGSWPTTCYFDTENVTRVFFLPRLVVQVMVTLPAFLNFTTPFFTVATFLFEDFHL